MKVHSLEDVTIEKSLLLEEQSKFFTLWARRWAELERLEKRLIRETVAKLQ